MLTEAQKQAILDAATQNADPLLKTLQEELYRPKGQGKTTRPSNLSRKRKAARKQTKASRRKNRG